MVLLDVVMPGMDGYQVLERLKGDPRLRHLPVVMVTAVDDVASAPSDASSSAPTTTSRSRSTPCLSAPGCGRG